MLVSEVFSVISCVEKCIIVIQNNKSSDKSESDKSNIWSKRPGYENKKVFAVVVMCWPSTHSHLQFSESSISEFCRNLFKNCGIPAFLYLVNIGYINLHRFQLMAIPKKKKIFLSWLIARCSNYNIKVFEYAQKANLKFSACYIQKRRNVSE